MDNRPIGVFDSGLGGLTGVKELRKRLPHENIVYFGDTGRVPYGSRSPETILQYARQDVAFLLSKNVKCIMAACGTVSSPYPAAEAAQLPVPYLGVVDAAAREAAFVTRNRRIGVIGTAATIRSRSYETLLRKLVPGVEITARPCPLFVPLVENGYVSGWDDPRMPTLCGLRRRGYTPKSIRNFCERVGVAKSPNTIPYAFLEFCLREDLNETARRVMAVLRPIKLTITNYPEGQSETVTVENNPNRPEDGVRAVTFSRNLYIEAEDFLETPVPKYKRLYPDGPECRLKGAYLIRCTGCVKDASGAVTEILCEYDPDSRGGDPADGRKVKGATIHWVDAATAVDAEVRLYDNLFLDADPDAGANSFLDCLNPDSLEVLTGSKVEAGLTDVRAPASFQFLRQGYFCVDNRDSAPGHLVFNRSVGLKDSFKVTK